MRCACKQTEAWRVSRTVTLRERETEREREGGEAETEKLGRDAGTQRQTCSPRHRDTRAVDSKRPAEWNH